MKKIYESPVAEVVSFTALEQMATVSLDTTPRLATTLNLDGHISYDTVDRTTSAFGTF